MENQEKETTTSTSAPLDFNKDVNQAELGVGDGTGEHIVKGHYETIKYLQAKLLRYEKIEQQLVNTILTLNDIPNQRTSQGKTYDVIKKAEEALGVPAHEWKEK